jgi:hypothetical protein
MSVRLPSLQHVTDAIFARSQKAIPGDQDDFPALVLIASRMEPAIRQQFLQIINDVRNDIDLTQLTQAVRGGRHAIPVEQALDNLERQLNTKLDPLMRRGFLNGASFATQELRTAGLVMSFNLVNPHAATWAANYTPQLAASVKQGGAVAIQQLIRESVEQGIPPEATARRIREHIGLTERDAKFLRKFETRLANQTEPVLAVEQIEARAGKMSEALVRRRASLIARTETIRAHNQGQLGAWNEAMSQGLLDKSLTKKKWVVTHDDRLDIVMCEPLDGKTVALSEPFTIAGVMAPPIHPACRCAIVLEIEKPQATTGPGIPVSPTPSPFLPIVPVLPDDDNESLPAGGG